MDESNCPLPSHDINSNHHNDIEHTRCKWTFLSKLKREEVKILLEKLSESNKIIGEHIDLILSIIFSSETGVVNLSELN